MLRRFAVVLAAPLLAGCMAAPAGTSSPSPSPSPTAAASSPAPSSPAPSAYEAKTSEWGIGFKVRETECYGSAGCNVTVAIEPTYSGSDPLPSAGAIKVTYELSGGDDPTVNTFTVKDGTASHDEEEIVSVPKKGAKITGRVTAATYSATGVPSEEPVPEPSEEPAPEPEPEPEPELEPEPGDELSGAKYQAFQKALSYLDTGDFSKSSLIKQLEFEGFSGKQSRFAVDYVEDKKLVSWQSEANGKAQSYLDTVGGFSCGRLVEQMKFEGFTTKQATKAAKKVGVCD